MGSVCFKATVGEGFPMQLSACVAPANNRAQRELAAWTSIGWTVLESLLWSRDGKATQRYTDILRVVPESRDIYEDSFFVIN